MATIALIPTYSLDPVQYREIDENAGHEVMSLIIGGTAETVVSPNVQMCVDEDAFEKALPLNHRATLIAGSGQLLNLYGTAVVFNHDGEKLLPLTNEQKAHIERYCNTVNAPSIRTLKKDEPMRTYVPKAPLW